MQGHFSACSLHSSLRPDSPRAPQGVITEDLHGGPRAKGWGFASVDRSELNFPGPLIHRALWSKRSAGKSSYKDPSFPINP